MTKALALAAGFLVGCSWSVRAPRRPTVAFAPPVDPGECARLDDRQLGLTAAGLAFSSLGGGASLAIAAVPDGTAKWGTAIGGVGSAAFGALFTSLGAGYRARYVARCAADR